MTAVLPDLQSEFLRIQFLDVVIWSEVDQLQILLNLRVIIDVRILSLLQKPIVKRHINSLLKLCFYNIEKKA